MKTASMLLALAALGPAQIGLSTSVLAAESAYTTFDADACTEISRENQGESVELKCPGYGGVPVFYSEGDLRADVDFGVPDGEFSTFGAFNNIGGKIEWRHSGDRPFAAIVRFQVAGDGEGSARRDVLLVAKVGREGVPGCPIAVIDVSSVEQPNGVARGVAALSAGFECGRENPIFVGAVDGAAAGFSNAVHEGRP